MCLNKDDGCFSRSLYIRANDERLDNLLFGDYKSCLQRERVCGVFYEFCEICRSVCQLRDADACSDEQIESTILRLEDHLRNLGLTRSIIQCNLCNHYRIGFT